MNIQVKASILRRHEALCYQICYYYTQDDELSIQAACEALLEVAHNSDFFTDTHEGQKKKVMLAAVRSTLKIEAIA
ncbi:hypothetical protein [Paenibacillus sp. FSL M7-0896]|uniref:hypothetical protein n=1 Tax=Paenibacillus sp. FSL M7-0896 TaxID=2921610 RepID=UPI0030DCE8F5